MSNDEALIPNPDEERPKDPTKKRRPRDLPLPHRGFGFDLQGDPTLDPPEDEAEEEEGEEA